LFNRKDPRGGKGKRQNHGRTESWGRGASRLKANIKAEGQKIVMSERISESVRGEGAGPKANIKAKG